MQRKGIKNIKNFWERKKSPSSAYSPSRNTKRLGDFYFCALEGSMWGRLKDVGKMINEGKIKAFLKTYCGEYEIIGVNPHDYRVLVKSKLGFERTFYCTPWTKVKLGGWKNECKGKNNWVDGKEGAEN